jgi:molecular chaperone GrpE
MVSDMNKHEENMGQQDDRIEIEVTDRESPIPRNTIHDAVETAEDFSGETEPEEEAHLAEEAPSAQSRIAELEDRLLRNAAEFDNYRRRTARQFEEISKSATDKLVGEFLEVLDNFERAKLHAGEKADVASLTKGMELIHGQMNALLAKNGITPIEAIGKPFDPNLHEALMQVETKEYPEGTIALEMAKGYQQGTRVIRHSKVGVSTGKAK